MSDEYDSEAKRRAADALDDLNIVVRSELEIAVDTVIKALGAPKSAASAESSLIAEAARLIAPAAGETVFYIRVGGDRTHMQIKAAKGVNPALSLDAAVAALAAEKAALTGCPVHTLRYQGCDRASAEWRCALRPGHHGPCVPERLANPDRQSLTKGENA